MTTLDQLRARVSQLEAEAERQRDREAIQDCLARYCRAIDRFDRELLMTVFHPDAVDDHGKFLGGPEQFWDWVHSQHTNAHLSTQHILANHTCELDGDAAHAETYFIFAGMNRKGVPLALTGGRYVDRFEKRKGRWRIAYRVCIREWALTDERPDFADLKHVRFDPPSAVRGEKGVHECRVRAAARPNRRRLSQTPAAGFDASEGVGAP